MKFDPNIHHRRSIRLKGYDYSNTGAYFITICCSHREHRFGVIEQIDDFTDTEMILNDFGQIAYDEWAGLPDRFQNIELDVFQIMPNHMHGIIVLKDIAAEPLAVEQKNRNEYESSASRAGASPAPTSVGNIIGSYKSLVANACLNRFLDGTESDIKSKTDHLGKIWQRNFHDHIIRDEVSYNFIANYIINNPKNWKDDKFYTN
jgi:putative transposase